MLKFLYETAPGRVVLKLLINPRLSKIVGAFLDMPISKLLIKPFVYFNHINLDDYESDNFTCFNDCFCRKIKKGARVIDKRRNVLIAPCDGYLTAYKITDETIIPVKQSRYRLRRLLRSKKLAEEFRNGYCLVYRLEVTNYHRYCYFDDGIKGVNHFINGKLHTVRPIALENVPVFSENSREFSVMKTRHFGKAIQMEVGAMLVGKIKNYHGKYRFRRGEEKGRFLYGGSTIIVLLKEGSVVIDNHIMERSVKQLETLVSMGERVGVKA